MFTSGYSISNWESQANVDTTAGKGVLTLRVLTLMNVQADNEEPHWQASATRTPKLNYAEALVLDTAIVNGFRIGPPC